jgi:hypothetical protein
MPVAQQMSRLTTLLAAYSTLAPLSYTLRSSLAAAPSSRSQYLTALRWRQVLPLELLDEDPLPVQAQ